jgi:class 3 adenylate cyclase
VNEIEPNNLRLVCGQSHQTVKKESEMDLAKADPVTNAVPPRLIVAVKQIAEDLEATSIRVWRYVDSQKALFGFWAEPPLQPPADHADLAFDDFVAFLREPEKLGKYSSTHVVDLSDDPDSSERKHRLWDVPEYLYLPKETRTHYIESILVNDPSRPTQTPDDLIGVICIDAPFSNYEKLPELGTADQPKSKERIHRLLDRIRDELRNYSLLHFREGFLRATRPYLDDPIEKSVEQREATGSLRGALERLFQAMGAEASNVSVYLRSVNREQGALSLIDGLGDFYSTLCAVETRLRIDLPPQFVSGLFSCYARKELEDPLRTEPLLFPGSGDSATYKDYKERFLSSRSCLQVIPEDVRMGDPFRDQSAHKANLSLRIVERGSFGVFPIRRMAETSLKGQLVALLCVAVLDKRNFFTWNRRLVLERFCHMVGRRHDAHIAPVLNRVSDHTHRELIASPHMLGKLLSKPGPLVRRGSQTEDRACSAFVISVDLRKSTDLMLKIVPESSGAYAKVLMELCERMRDAVKEEYGIFDKFTGDGVLAFFPQFFSGSRPDAAYRVIAAAERCHRLFEEYYERFWPSLLTVPIPGSAEEVIPDSVGLGIGIDYGLVRLVNVGDELTIVGAPVVYACRMSGSAYACTTLLNHRAFGIVKKDGLLDLLEWTRESAKIKHEGSPSIAYRVRLKPREVRPTKDWTLPTTDDLETWRDS